MKLCVVCNKEFEPRNSSQKSCSHDCVDKWYFIRKKRRHDAQPFVEKECIFCHNIFKYKVRKDRERNFCNRSCASKFYIANGTYDEWQQAGKIASIEPKFPVNCAGCGKEILLTQVCIDSYAKNGNKHCCNVKCRGEYTRQCHTGKTFSLSEEAKAKQKATILEKYGVENAYALAKHRVNTKPQNVVLDFLKEKFSKLDWESEKYIKYDIGRGKGYHVDIFCKKLNLIIEFNGDYWHCNPFYYSPDFQHHKKNKNAYNIWEEDKIKLVNLAKLKHNIIIVWECELKSDKWKERLLSKIEKLKAVKSQG